MAVSEMGFHMAITQIQILRKTQAILQNTVTAFQNTLTKAGCVNQNTEKHFQIPKSDFITMIIS